MQSQKRECNFTTGCPFTAYLLFHKCVCLYMSATMCELYTCGLVCVCVCVKSAAAMLCDPCGCRWHILASFACEYVCMCVSLWSWAQLWYGKFSSGYSYIILSAGRCYSHLWGCALVTSSSSEPLVIRALDNTEMMPLGPFRIKSVTIFCNTVTKIHTFLIFSESFLQYSSIYKKFDWFLRAVCLCVWP